MLWVGRNFADPANFNRDLPLLILPELGRRFTLLLMLLAMSNDLLQVFEMYLITCVAQGRVSAFVEDHGLCIAEANCALAQLMDLVVLGAPVHLRGRGGIRDCRGRGGIRLGIAVAHVGLCRGRGCCRGRGVAELTGEAVEIGKQGSLLVLHVAAIGVILFTALVPAIAPIGTFVGVLPGTGLGVPVPPLWMYEPAVGPVAVDAVIALDVLLLLLPELVFLGQRALRL